MHEKPYVDDFSVHSSLPVLLKVGNSYLVYTRLTILCLQNCVNIAYFLKSVSKLGTF